MSQNNFGTIYIIWIRHLSSLFDSVKPIKMAPKVGATISGVRKRKRSRASDHQIDIDEQPDIHVPALRVELQRSAN